MLCAAAEIKNKLIASLTINLSSAGGSVGKPQRQDPWKSGDCVQFGTFNTKQVEHC
jgi:hypothetical protein